MPDAQTPLLKFPPKDEVHQWAIRPRTVVHYSQINICKFPRHSYAQRLNQVSLIRT